MNSPKPHLVWLRQLALLMFAALVMFFHLIPFTLTPATLPAPDILYCIICVLIIRRPEIVPFWMIALIYFGFDVFQAKPLGVWTACILITSEVLRASRDTFRKNLFLFEWMTISLAFFLTLVVNRLLWIVTFIPTPSVSCILWEFAFTILAYPIILFVITYVLRIRKFALGEFGNIG